VLSAGSPEVSVSKIKLIRRNSLKNIVADILAKQYGKAVG